jgi:hypothetical protein
VKEVNDDMAKGQELIYALVGAGDLAISKIADARILTDRKKSEKVYKDFVKRGRSLTTRIKNSGPTKQAITQTKTARTQVKAAATSVTKAVRTTATGPTKKAVEQTKAARSQVKAAATSVTKAVRADAKATTAAAKKVAKAS